MRLVLALSLLAIFSFCVPTLVTAEASENHKIIVIGAGPAGLGAARNLTDAGYDVVVLEARDRIGGRILTDHWNNTSFDLGASWIHGINGNPIKTLAEKYGIQTIPFDNESSAIIYDGATPISEERKKSMGTIYNDFVDFYYKVRQNISGSSTDISLQQAVDDFIKERNLNETEIKDLNFNLVDKIEGDYAADTSDISLLSSEYMGYKMGGHEVVFPQGYEQIVHNLAKGLDIRNKTIVKEIDYGDSSVNIKTDKGDFGAKYVISTLPLGVLKNDTAVNFVPDLPSTKKDAIDKLKMGVLNKVYFVFPNVFWNDDYDWIEHIPDKKGYWVYFANLHRVTGSPVLLGFNTGSSAKAIDAEPSDEKIVSDGLAVLREMYGDSVPEPLYTKVTRWGNDPYAGGSYSYTGVHSTNADYYELSKPLENKLFFAGEATEVRYPATVHGAYMSGIREALRIQAVDNQYSPYAQIKSGILPEYVLCKEGLELALFAPDSSDSLCVKSSTKTKLIERGWSICPESIEQILSANDPKSLSCKTSLLTYNGYMAEENGADGYDN